MPTSLEICAGAGGTALGLERAGFRHVGLVEYERWACETLRLNRPKWNVVHADVRAVKAKDFRRFDLLSGGVPCPPFSHAGKQMGRADERDLFPEVLRLAAEGEPKGVMVENVRGLLDPEFKRYRGFITRELNKLGFEAEWQMLNACDFGVPQLRPRVVLVALRSEYASRFQWPEPHPKMAATVGEALLGEMQSRGWRGAREWARRADSIAPTLVGGSTRHGGPDLGPTRARQDWARLGVEGRTIAEEPPAPDHEGMPRLTVRMAAILQGFPEDWLIAGKKTPAYRQVGNAFPPPVAEAVGTAMRKALRPARRRKPAEAAA